MKDNKDIFDLFRDNEHKLIERPSDRAWQRLEHRLDSRPGRRRTTPWFRNILSMTGVLLMLVVLISVISLLFSKTGTEQAAADMAPKPQFVLEEIGIYNEEKPDSYNISTYKKQLSRLNTNPFLEGDPSKELRVQRRVFIALRNRSIDADNNNSSKTTSVADNMEKPTASAKETHIAYKEEEAVSNYGYSDVTEDATPIPTTRAANSGAEMDLESSNLEEEEMSAGATAAMSRKESLSYASDDASVASTTIGLDQFRWIIGQWEAPVEEEGSTSEKSKKADRAFFEKNTTPTTRRSIEEWRLNDDNMISGIGTILSDGDTTFTESMRIELVNDQLFYVLFMDNQLRKYSLKKYTPHEIIFENEALTFPNQVVLLPDATKARFTTLLKNNNPTQLNKEELKYFQNRNQISSEQIKRIMVKTME